MILRCLLLLIFFSSVEAKNGVTVSALKDPCWGKCIKIKIGKPCKCDGRVGVTNSFFEPLFLMDVTEEPYRLVSLGGLQLIKLKNNPKKGLVYERNPGDKSSFQHVHFYILPMAKVMQQVLNITMSGWSEIMTLPYLSELDLSWTKQKWSLLADPEAVLFSHPIMQTACLADCLVCTANKPIRPDPLFWCAGCSGSLYPLSGYVEHHINEFQASTLLAHRVLAKLHKFGLLRAYPDKDPCKGLHYQPLLRKRNYRLQQVYPNNRKNCDLPGRSTMTRASLGKIDPTRQRDFSFIIWRRRVACLGVPIGF